MGFEWERLASEFMTYVAPNDPYWGLAYAKTRSKMSLKTVDAKTSKVANKQHISRGIWPKVGTRRRWPIKWPHSAQIQWRTLPIPLFCENCKGVVPPFDDRPRYFVVLAERSRISIITERVKRESKKTATRARSLHREMGSTKVLSSNFIAVFSVRYVSCSGVARETLIPICKYHQREKQYVSGNTSQSKSPDLPVYFVLSSSLRVLFKQL